ncbi:zinc finger BED domain-containing protein 5-like [Palaemon carinicauda]|uniref:zinc finger BED domain-containing protein 5-like n=1 Tax=Palaemon carinicauda TaxID=392227 RepID=UPI0035B632AD
MGKPIRRCQGIMRMHLAHQVRWLSRGNTTRRLFELRDVLLVFFKEKEHDFQKDLEDEEFISRLAYLSDIFGALNHLNLSFQGPDCTVTEFILKLGAFVRKLDLWMKNVETDLPVGAGEQEELIDIQADETAKTKHKECFPLNFWVSMASSYPTLARHAVPQLLIFPSTWECEQRFLAFMAIKSKSRNCLAAPGHDFRRAVSKVMPRIDQLVEKKQIQPLH